MPADRSLSEQVEGPSGTGKRVLLVCDWFLKYVAPFAVALSRAGARVAVLCRDHAAEFEGNADERRALVDGMIAAGVTVIVMPGSNGVPSRAAWGALRAARGFGADIVHAQSDILDPRMLLAVGRAPLVLMVHDPEPHLGGAILDRHHQALQALWRRRADLILLHGERLASAFGPTRLVRVLAHGMAAQDQAMPAPAEDAVLLFGRLEYYKGARVLVDAMKLVWEQRPEVRLIVAGNGREARQIPDDPRIELRRGYIPEAEVDALFARASIVALPYLDASQSGVGLLALGRGVPVVVTDVGELPTLVPDESFVAQPGDAASLAERLLEHLDHDTDFRRGLLDWARSTFGWDAVAVAAIRIYDELVALRPGGGGRFSRRFSGRPEVRGYD
jgi:starch synthase